MAEKWFISDTHLFHNNMLKFIDKKGAYIRPFKSLDEMHHKIVSNWNKFVSVEDYVYHLGDVTFQYHKPFVELMFNLKGHKRLIVGNHDKLKNEHLLKCFEKVELWKGFKEYDFTCSHIPLRLESLRDGHFNVHGHLHTKLMEDPHYINVCVETRDYTPVHLNQILNEIKRVNENNSNTNT